MAGTNLDKVIEDKVCQLNDTLTQKKILKAALEVAEICHFNDWYSDEE